jgi:hypothetical protein
MPSKSQWQFQVKVYQISNEYYWILLSIHSSIFLYSGRLVMLEIILCFFVEKERKRFIPFSRGLFGFENKDLFFSSIFFGLALLYNEVLSQTRDQRARMRLYLPISYFYDIQGAQENSLHVFHESYHKVICTL